MRTALFMTRAAFINIHRHRITRYWQWRIHLRIAYLKMRGTCQPTTYQGHCRQNARAYLQGKDLRRQYPCLITDGRIFEGKRLGKHVLPCVVPQVTRTYRDRQTIGLGGNPKTTSQLRKRPPQLGTVRLTSEDAYVYTFPDSGQDWPPRARVVKILF